jgi:IPT/TIG domain
VGVALNGQQFSKDFILHVKDDENTYEYYNDPIITSFTPHSGPNIGGTQVTINGLGFTPIKDTNGNPDKKKNKMWVRFVDPETGEPLAKEYQVKPEDLSDD